MKNIITSIALIALLVACQSKKGHQSNQQTAVPDSTYVPAHSKGFLVNYYKDYRQIVLNDPWGDSTKTETIAIVSDPALKNILAQHNDYVISGSSDKWIALSSTMVNYADKLDMKHTIGGVAEPQYISDAYIQNELKNGNIKNIGLAVAPDVEVIMAMEPDFMMVSPFKDSNFKAVRAAGIPIVTNSSYLEHSPLGRAEWLVFVGELLGKGEKAKRIFRQIEQKYVHIKRLTETVDYKPTVFTGHIYKGVWYTPAGDSYMANFFNDAGCNYIYKDSEGTGSLSLDYETIIDKAEQTEYWVLIINHPKELSYSGIRNMDDRYTDFEAFKNRQIISTNSSVSHYFEKGLLQPDVVLSDLVKALHPDLLKDYQASYFTRLKKE